MIRDALARLKDEGYVRSQRGSGNVVVRGEAPGRHRVSADPHGLRPAALVRIPHHRRGGDRGDGGGAARADATSPTSSARSTRAANALDHGVYHLLADLNFEFHRAVARATHNPFYLKTVEMIPNFIGAERLDLTTFGDEDLPERARRIHDEHVAIFEAIRRREPEQARRARWSVTSPPRATSCSSGRSSLRRPIAHAHAQSCSARPFERPCRAPRRAHSTEGGCT